MVRGYAASYDMPSQLNRDVIRMRTPPSAGESSRAFSRSFGFPSESVDWAV